MGSVTLDSRVFMAFWIIHEHTGCFETEAVEMSVTGLSELSFLPENEM